tara:strand:- start:966 stop:2138 length:1173 start_codon:yes stop_codon:yes gene_type:complete
MSILRADSIRNKDGDGAPDFPNGITVAGIVTATLLDQNVTGVVSATSFVGDGSALTGTGVSITGGVEATYTENAINYESRSFYSPGSFTITSPMTVEFCIIAGGGGGANFYSTNANGGGGAGGVVIGRGVVFPAGSYDIRVGDGGEGACPAPQGTAGRRGHDSSIKAPHHAPVNYVATGGGGGHSPQQYPTSYVYTQGKGGSGGGRSDVNNPGYTTIQNTYDAPTAPMPIGTYNDTPFRNSGTVNGYGNNGGSGTTSSWGGGGGGGAAGNGTNGPGGNGGPGMTFPWSNGPSGIEYIAGGGGGSGNSTEPAGDGHSGGGRGQGTTVNSGNDSTYGEGQLPAAPYGMLDVHALDGSGGGGGGGSYWHSTSVAQGAYGGRGGSGRVVIRFEV